MNTFRNRSIQQCAAWKEITKTNSQKHGDNYTYLSVICFRMATAGKTHQMPNIQQQHSIRR